MIKTVRRRKWLRGVFRAGRLSRWCRIAAHNALPLEKIGRGGLMRRALTFSLFVVLVIALPSLAVQESKELVLKVRVPEEDAVVTVNDKQIDGTGKERVIKVAEPPKGKDFHTVTAVWEPNNYTRFTRTRKVPADAKGAAVVVDLTKAYDTEKI